MANRTDGLFAAITREVGAREEIFAAEERLVGRRAKIAAEVVQIEARREAERAAIIRRAGEERAALERERAAAVAAIERRWQRVTTDAIAERDALAAHQARNAAADQLAENDAAAQVDLARLQMALDRQSRTLDSHYAERIAALMTSTRREEAEVTAAANRAERARLVVTQIGGAGREQQEATHQTNLSSILNFGLSMAESRWQQFMATILQAIPGGTGSASSSVNLTVNATAPAAIHQQVDSRLNEYFRRAGYTEY